MLHFDFPAKLAGQKVGLTHRALLELCTIKTVYKIDADQTALMCMLICIFVYGISMFSHDAWDIGSVRQKDWPHVKHRSWWPIFQSSDLLYISKTIWLRSMMLRTIIHSGTKILALVHEATSCTHWHFRSHLLVMTVTRALSSIWIFLSDSFISSMEGTRNSVT